MVFRFASAWCTLSAIPQSFFCARTVHKLLMDTVTSEFLVCCDFLEDESVFRELLALILNTALPCAWPLP